MKLKKFLYPLVAVAFAIVSVGSARAGKFWEDLFLRWSRTQNTWENFLRWFQPQSFWDDFLEMGESAFKTMEFGSFYVPKGPRYFEKAFNFSEAEFVAQEHDGGCWFSAFNGFINFYFPNPEQRDSIMRSSLSRLEGLPEIARLPKEKRDGLLKRLSESGICSDSLRVLQNAALDLPAGNMGGRPGNPLYYKILGLPGRNIGVENYYCETRNARNYIDRLIDVIIELGRRGTPAVMSSMDDHAVLFLTCVENRGSHDAVMVVEEWGIRYEILASDFIKRLITTYEYENKDTFSFYFSTEDRSKNSGWRKYTDLESNLMEFERPSAYPSEDFCHYTQSRKNRPATSYTPGTKFPEITLQNYPQITATYWPDGEKRTETFLSPNGKKYKEIFTSPKRKLTKISFFNEDGDVFRICYDLKDPDGAAPSVSFVISPEEDFEIDAKSLDEIKMPDFAVSVNSLTEPYERRDSLEYAYRFSPFNKIIGTKTYALFKILDIGDGDPLQVYELLTRKDLCPVSRKLFTTKPDGMDEYIKDVSGGEPLEVKSKFQPEGKYYPIWEEYVLPNGDGTLKRYFLKKRIRQKDEFYDSNGKLVRRITYGRCVRFDWPSEEEVFFEDGVIMKITYGYTEDDASLYLAVYKAEISGVENGIFKKTDKIVLKKRPYLHIKNYDSDGKTVTTRVKLEGDKVEFSEPTDSSDEKEWKTTQEVEYDYDDRLKKFNCYDSSGNKVQFEDGLLRVTDPQGKLIKEARYDKYGKLTRFESHLEDGVFVKAPEAFSQYSREGKLIKEVCHHGGRVCHTKQNVGPCLLHRRISTLNDERYGKLRKIEEFFTNHEDDKPLGGFTKTAYFDEKGKIVRVQYYE